MQCALCDAPSGYIDWLRFYYHRRLHSTLGYLSPMAFEKKWLGDDKTPSAKGDAKRGQGQNLTGPISMPTHMATIASFNVIFHGELS